MESNASPYKMKVFSYDGEKEVTMSPIDSIALLQTISTRRNDVHGSAKWTNQGLGRRC